MTITANTAPQASGILASQGVGSTITITGAATRVSGNTGAGYECATTPDDINFTDVPGCAF
ncbi:MAG: hypothetical protein ACR2J8_11450 [Thermomicrobiales bacterium]